MKAKKCKWEKPVLTKIIMDKDKSVGVLAACKAPVYDPGPDWTGDCYWAKYKNWCKGAASS